MKRLTVYISKKKIDINIYAIIMKLVVKQCFYSLNQSKRRKMQNKKENVAVHQSEVLDNPDKM